MIVHQAIRVTQVVEVTHLKIQVKMILEDNININHPKVKH